MGVRCCIVCSAGIDDRPISAITCEGVCHREHRLRRERESLWRSPDRQKRKKRWRTKNRVRLNEYNRKYYARRTVPRSCMVCGAIIAFGIRRKTCSDLCQVIRSAETRRRWLLTRKVIRKVRPCVICGRDFSGRQGAKACSVDCSAVLYRQGKARRKDDEVYRRARVDYRRNRRNRATITAEALIYSGILERPKGLSRNERRKWNDLLLRATNSLNLSGAAT